MQKVKQLIPLFIFFLAVSAYSQADFQNLPTYSIEGYVNVVVEIPAGTNHKIEYDKGTFEFKVDQKNGKDRIIDFLPYPGNYGFIPSTYMDPADGGDGDALDIIVLSASTPSRTIMEVLPIALMLLIDGGEIDSKIVAVPAYSNAQIMNITCLADLDKRYPAVKGILENWFLNYKGAGVMKLKGWEDEKAALKEIEKWAVKEEK